MNINRLFFTSLLIAFLSNPMPCLADDIDLYSGLAGNANIPNVMVIVDNAANSDAQMTACTYWDGATPTGSNQGTKSLDNYMCALDSLAHSLTTRSDGTALVNIGITTQAGVYLKLTPVDDKPYTGTFPGTAGKTNRQAISIAVRAMTVTTGSAQQGSSFQETWAYYTGGNGGTTNVGENSGVAYSGTNATAGCQRNYIIFISGVTPSAHSAKASSLTNLTNAVNNAVNTPVTSAGTTLANALTTPVTYNLGSEKPYGIEWARFMYSTDINGGATGTQNIVTYSIAAGAPLYPAAMGSWEQYIYDTAKYGGGKYFAATSYSAIYQDILKILNEVQAVNSVFASSSLPVSVNAQGTYLNQVYMGMFRPDPNGLPRWLGNLKQYQFAYNVTTNTLTLADSTGAAALSSAGTGFLSPNAISFWTSKNTSVLPDSAGGYWVNMPQSAGGGYDSSDGEIVEKGGVAQTLRTANLYDTYTATAGSATNPRNVFTYCPSSSGCVADLTNASNAFSLANTGITASAFNAANLSVSSIVRTGTTALVTTTSPHGFSTGTLVTISGASPNDYNVSQQSVTVNSGTTFTISGLGDYPNTPSQAAYTAALHNSSTKTISSVSVATSTTSNSNGCSSGTIPNINCDQVTVTLPNHGYSNGNTINIAGVLPAAYYSGSFVISNVTTNTFTYNVPVTPTSPSVNAYSATLPAAPVSITSISYANGSNKTTVTVSSGSFTAGQSVTITGSSVAANNGTYTIASPSGNTFKITGGGSSCSSGCGTAAKANPVYSIAAGNISRTSATATTATVTGVTASAFSNGQTVNLAWASGTGANESAYAPLTGTNSVVITCSGTCTSFTFPITASPSTTVTTSSPTAALTSTPVTIPMGAITRASSGSTATVTGVANTFTSGQSVDIGVSGAANANESAYVGTWTITCPVNCSTAFTFGPVVLTPTSPAGGTITAYGGTPPDRTSLINWVRGLDNAGDEQSPDPSYTKINIRGSVHGDVLHSRPAVINYGGTTGVVVFYGANDGMFRAVNGNQTNPSGSTLPVPGSELWSFVMPEFIGGLTRLHDNSPALQLPSTPPGITPTPTKKQYFADGSAGVYQQLNADGTTKTAYLYVTVRRGGNFMYALDVSNPAKPQLLWKISATGDFSELGQTWSHPKVALVKGYSNPVLIFGAGYDSNEDSEPPGADTSGRGIYIVDAITGSLVWRATYGASDGCSAGICTKKNMQWSIPSELALMDVNGDGYIDRLYAADTGGNIWRVDLEPNGYSSSSNGPSTWRVTQLAALGCSTGACASGTTPRKFFFPPEMVPTGQYHAVLIGSGDREHPLYSNGSYSVVNRFYMIKDINTGSAGTDLYTSNIESKLEDITPVAPATTSAYDGLQNGYYLTLATGEKVVNAATVVAGYTYFGTNIPATPSSNSCISNLGTAKGYAVNPLLGNYSASIYSGGGLPPTTVAGIVDIIIPGTGGAASTTKKVPFCIGCGGGGGSSSGGGGGDCKSSSIGSCKPPINVPTNRSKKYWYIENK